MRSPLFDRTDRRLAQRRKQGHATPGLPLLHGDSPAGFALPLALAGIVIVGVLAASGLYLSGQERRAGENVGLAERAFAVAELGLGTVVDEWNAESAAALAIGTHWTTHAASGPDSASIDAVRIGTRTFWIVSEGRASQGDRWARRRLNQILRLEVPALDISAAIESAGPMEIAAGATVDGSPGVLCDNASVNDRAGIAAKSLMDISGDLGSVTGAPPLLARSAAGEALALGSPTHEWLVQAATVVLDGGTSPLLSRPLATGGACDLTMPTNWGEPDAAAGVSPCRTARRIVHARGDLLLEGEHRGQGILLVDGDLSIPGRLRYRGLLVVQGRLDVTGDLQLEGAAVVRGAGGSGPSRLGTGSGVQYGHCEISRALTVAGRPVVARERGWADLF